MDLDEIIILKDGTFIADVPSLNDYLEGLGFDIYTLSNMYIPKNGVKSIMFSKRIEIGRSVKQTIIIVCSMI